MGFEPTTPALRKPCSTVELPRHKKYYDTVFIGLCKAVFWGLCVVFRSVGFGLFRFLFQITIPKGQNPLHGQ